MQFKRILALLCLCVLIATVGYSAEEYRKLGVEDLEISSGGTGAAETAVSAGGVSSTKIDSATINMRTSPGGTIDNAIVTKQPLDAQLTTLSAPTAWRLYYSGATDWAALAFGTSGQCLKSGGASAAPTFGDCGGSADLNNSTMDNTVIGGTTPVAGTFTTVTGTSGVFTSITRGTVSDTEFSYLDGVTSAIQTQLNAKQAYDADLAVLSAPTAWRIFYSNSSSAITELALGTSGQFLKSNGASSAPSWVSSTVTSLDNTTMDNTVIGGTTPVAGTFTTLTADNAILAEGTYTTVNIDNGTIDNVVIGATTATAGTFTTLAKNGVTNAQFGYLGDVTSAIQAQIDLKAPIATPTFTGIVTTDNEVVATQFTSTGADNTHSINVLNTAAPSTPSDGDTYYDNTLKFNRTYQGDAWKPVGKVVEILDNVAGPTAEQSYGSLNVVNADITVLLPTAVAGMSMCVLDSGTAHDIIVDVQAGDDISLSGTEQANGVGITSASGSSTGDYVCVIATSAGHWMTMQKQGTWASQ